MDTQTEIKKVITVDLGNTATTLKEYKNHIDELRGSLLQLDESSEEYKEIAKEIKVEQDKLNEVMKAGKYDVDAAEGSYNQLAKTMAELKKQWKATADEAERKELGQRILDINNQLKELDQSTGNYQRSVGDYANAFEQAFGKCLDGIRSLDGPLGELGGMTKQLIPVIKSINATALSGLSGIKKAIASTGIGLLVVGVGMLASHWDDVKKAVSNLNPLTRRYNDILEETKRKVEQIKQEWDKVQIAQELHLQVMQAQGASTLEQLEYIRDNSRKRLEDLDKANAGLAKGMEEADRLIANGAKAEDLFGGQYTQRLTEYNDYQKQRLELTKQISDAEWNISLENIKREASANKEKEAQEKANAEKAKARADDRRKQYEQERTQAEALYEQIRQNSLTELELLDEKYAKEKAQLEKFGLDTTLLTKQYESERAEIIASEEDKILSAISERYDNITSIYDQEAEQLSFEAEIEIENEQELADAKYQIEQDLIDKKIAALEQYKEEVMLTNQDISGIETELDALRRQYANNKMKYDKESTDYAKKKSEEEKKAKMQAFEASLSVASSVFGALGDLAEENSDEAKAFAIMQTTIDTLSGAIAAYKSMAGVPYVGPALGAAAAAAVTLAGIANIAKIKSTTKESSSSASVSTPQINAPTMTSVSPLLNEQEDLNRLEAYGQNTPTQQNIRCYVVEQDISDAQNKVQVVEDNVTF